MKSSHTAARSLFAVAGTSAAGFASAITPSSEHARRLQEQKGDSVPAVALYDQFRASRSRVLLEVLAYQLGHLEHAHGRLAAEHFLQRRIRVDVPLVFGIL